jgi:hypothetical protein
VLSGSKQGANLIKELEKGLSLHITRCLVDPALKLPYLDCHIDVPHVLASITDDEYSFCCEVSLANLREPMRLPVSALWVQDQINALSQAPSTPVLAPAPVSLLGAVPEASPPGDDVSTAGAQHSAGAPTPEHPVATTTSPSLMRTAVSSRLRATLQFGIVELELRNALGANSTSLALLHSSHLFISYASDGPGDMDVRVCLPRLEAHDLRSVRRAHSSLVLSSSYHTSGVDQSKAGEDALVGPSLLMIHYLCAADGTQDVALRLQRPTVVAEVDFMVAMLKFVVPALPLGAEPKLFTRRDVQCGPVSTLNASHISVSTPPC